MNISNTYYTELCTDEGDQHLSSQLRGPRVESVDQHFLPQPQVSPLVDESASRMFELMAIQEEKEILSLQMTTYNAVYHDAMRLHAPSMRSFLDEKNGSDHYDASMNLATDIAMRYYGDTLPKTLATVLTRMYHMIGEECGISSRTNVKDLILRINRHNCCTAESIMWLRIYTSHLHGGGNNQHLFVVEKMKERISSIQKYY